MTRTKRGLRLWALMAGVALMGCEESELPPKPSYAPVAAPQSPESKADDTARKQAAATASTQPRVPEIAPPDKPLPEPALAGFEQVIRDQIAEALAEARSNPTDAEAVGTVGMLYQVYDLVDAAEAWYREAIQLEPTNFQWNYLLANVFARQGNLEECVDALTRATLLRPDYLPARVMLAATLLQGGDLESAGLLVNDLLKHDTESDIINYTAGMVYLADKQWVYAIEFLKQVLDRNPEMGGVRRALAQAFRELGQDDKADELLARPNINEAIPTVSDPERAAPYRLAKGAGADTLKGKAYLKTGRFEEALEHFEEALSAEPDALLARQGKADALINLSRFAESEQLVRETLAQNEKDLVSLIQLGDLMLLQGRPDEAAKVSDQIAEIDPGNVTALAIRARAAKETKDYPAAISAYEQLALSNPDNPRVFLELGNVCELGELPDRAEEAYQRSLDLLPGNAYAMHRLAELYAGRSEFAAAYTWYKRAIAASPKELGYRRDFALAAMRARDFAHARDVLQSAVESNPEAHECAMLLARLYALCPDQSIRDGAAALRLADKVCADPQHRTPKLLDTLAAAHVEAGQPDEALKVYDEALEKAREQENPGLVTALERHRKQVEAGEPISDEVEPGPE